LLETSRQAQVLIPMATSLSFGLIFGTALVLILAPVGFFIIAKLSGEPLKQTAETLIETS
jgi:hydrophobic/amphiphilic exporter-1 (mainly G- bacteria), HAE1 family